MWSDFSLNNFYKQLVVFVAVLTQKIAVGVDNFRTKKTREEYLSYNTMDAVI